MPFVIWLRSLAVQRCITLARRHLGAEARDARREQPLAAAGARRRDVDGARGGAVRPRDHAQPRGRAQETPREPARGHPDARPLDREIVCLRNFEVLDNAEAAAVLGITPAAASKRFLRALVRLREALAAVGLDAPTGGLV